MKRRDSNSLVKVEDLVKRRTWVEHFLTDAARLPISFVHGGEQMRGIPAAWQPTSVTRRLDANLTETVIEGRDPKSGLQVRVECTSIRTFRWWNGWRGSTMAERKLPPS
jgi:hypothetical protein